MSSGLTTSPAQLARSYAYCKRIARRHAGNFYYSFVVLPPDRRAAMCAIYAFMRYSDDLADEGDAVQDRRERLKGWRRALERALEGDYGNSPILPAFADVVQRYAIPPRFFHELIDGAEMDLSVARYETFADLYRYCYRVASTVGFVCLHVWGFTGGEEAYVPAEACGVAFQLTNILRDVKEDAGRGRIYLPQEDLRRFGCSEQELAAGREAGGVRDLLAFEAARAREHYERAMPLLPMIEPAGQATFLIMVRIYRGLLDAIEARGYDVFAGRVRLSAARKIAIVGRAWLDTRRAPGPGPGKSGRRP